MDLHSPDKIIPPYLVSFAQAAAGKYLTVIVFDFVCRTAFSGQIIGTACAYVVGPAKQYHFGILT